jgi:hypothetical protein
MRPDDLYKATARLTPAAPTSLTLVAMSELSLAFGFSFHDLYDRDGLVRLDRAFADHLKTAEADLFNRLMAARAEPAAIEDKDHSDLLTELGPVAESFVATLFGIEDEVAAGRARRDRLNPIYACKRVFVRRRAAKAFKPDELAAADGPALRREVEALIGDGLNELTFARAVMTWLDDEEANAEKLAAAARFAAWAALSEEGRHRYRKSPLFHLPGSAGVDYMRCHKQRCPFPDRTPLRSGPSSAPLEAGRWRLPSTGWIGARLSGNGEMSVRPRRPSPSRAPFL